MSRGQFFDTRAAENTTLADLIPKVAQVSVLKKGGDIEAIRLAAVLRDRITEYSLSRLSTAIVADYRDRRLLEVSGSTVARDMALLHHVAEKARKEWGVGLQSNPFAGVEKPKAAPGRVRQLGDHEARAILIECGRSRGGYLRPVVMLALETAMRQSEIVDLDWGRIDLKKRVARLWTTKNGETRGVPLSWNAVDILEQLPAERNERGERAGRVFPELATEALKVSVTPAPSGRN
jgi:integrase